MKARLSYPGGVAVDRAGNVYIADSGNRRIRKVTVDGNIVTIAGNGFFTPLGDGGQGTSATLNFPEDVAVDGAGNVYISDSGNFRIRKLGTDGIIRTFAGVGQMGQSGDGGLATAAQVPWMPMAIC
jgi:sugar lactone lactonase YvrE